MRLRERIVMGFGACLLFASAATYAADPEKEKKASDEEADRVAQVSRLGDPGGLVQIGFEAREHTTFLGPDSRRQMVVTGEYSSGQLRDLTRDVTFATEPEGVVQIDAGGLVLPLADGKATVTARLAADVAGNAEEATTTLELTVEAFTELVEINFPNQIVPIFTKYGCNSGGCHGKSGGQNGFRLSLLGFYPEEDHEYLVKESRGRRVFTASPERSLLLMKSTNETPHGGGLRIEKDSHEYRLLRRWMMMGMPYGAPDAPRVESISVHPRQRTMDSFGRQQLAVYARYTDGRVEDVTRMAQYEPNSKEMAETTLEGAVKTLDLTGDVGIMVRFQAQVDVFRATIPLGAKVESLPPARNFLDELVFDKLKRLGLPPSAVCDDQTFLRRVTIDIAGRTPTAEEARAFEADNSAEKRDALIDRLLASTDYADHFANKWSAILRNKRENNKYRRGTFVFHEWIRDSMNRNLPYDRFVRAIVAASGEVGRHPPVVWYRSVKTSEQQLEDSAQLFLGLRIQCARCHHHPFERWSQKDYYSFAAFFSRVGRKDGMNGLNKNDEPRIYHNVGLASARNPRTQEDVKPSGLGAEPLDIPKHEDPRIALVDWMAKPENPFFAPSLVNRYWKHFFDRGLVEPEDDMRVTNPPSNPRLLKALADHFIASGFDLKDLVRSICRSTTYQLSSLPNEHNARDRQNYSRYYPKRLKAEILYDSINVVTGARPNFPGLPAGTRAIQLPDTGVNNYFLTVFGRPMADSACECERSQDANLAQSLHLLNSSDIQKKISDGSGRAASLAKDEKRSHAEKITELYYWAFSRSPDAEEMKLASAYVEKAEKKQLAYEDIVWALINTKEFLFNH